MAEMESSDSAKRNGTRSEEATNNYQPPTNYLETLANLFKANVGTGCFAMASGIKNSGIFLGPVLTLIIAIICVHCFHLIVKCAEHIMQTNNLNTRPDYAETIELSFALSRNEKWRNSAKLIRKICNVCIIITQLGFCSVYLVFVGRSAKLLLDHYGYEMDIKIIVTIIFVPIWLSVMLRKLKQIAIFSVFANICMIAGTLMTVAYAFQDLPPIKDRDLVNIQSLPLFFGTVLFAFTGIAVVLPLLNAMKKPEKFASVFGVLNVGMFFTTFLYVAIGFVGYWRYGNDTQASITLNLPIDEMLAQIIIIVVAIGVALTVAIQFFVAIQIMLPAVAERSEFTKNHPILTEEIFRTFWILVTFTVAQVVPNLGLLLSFIGAGCCTALVFVFPAISELIVANNREGGISRFIWAKNSIILIIAFFGGIMGMALSVFDLIKEF